MVENSLGRLWLDGHSDCSAKSEWKYYLEEAEQEESVRAQLDEIRKEYRALNPEQIKFIDPCMGSGHILIYAFEVLMQIYTSCGYSERGAAQLIVKKNLYGLDIDQRAYQLAYFSLMMKARQYDRRFLTRNIKPNLAHFQGLASVQNAYVTGAIKEFAEQFENCDTYGSLTEMHGIKGLDEALDDFSGVIDMDFSTTERMMTIYKALTQKYDVVCTNPPYMGGSGMSGALSDFVKKNYPDSKSDLFACFIERGFKYAKSNGYMCMVTMQSWMFLSSFETMREKALTQRTITNLMHMENMVMGIAFGTAVTVFYNSPIKGYKGTYNQIKLADIDKETATPIEFPVMNNRFAQVSSENFSKIPGAPVAYWVSENFIRAFENKKLGDYAYSFQGMITGDNNYFLRLWYEPNKNKLFVNLKNEDASKFNDIWIPYNKGGGFRKWYGNNEYTLRWIHNGTTLTRARTENSYYYFKEGVTWSFVTSGTFSCRYFPNGYLWDVAGSSVFANSEISVYYICALLNCIVSQKIFNVINPTINYQVQNIISIPVANKDYSTKMIENLGEENVKLSKTDWDSFETSWDFKKHPLVSVISDQLPVTGTDHYPLTTEHYYKEWEKECSDRFNTLKQNEEELNRIFIDIYGLQDELTPEVEDKDVTVRRADLQREIKSLVSYAVGCMFGRYSLDREGLVFAGGDFDKVYWKHKGIAALDENGDPIGGGYASFSQAPYQYLRFKENKDPDEVPFLTYAPDYDNCIPITDDNYFGEDDIVKRFTDFIKVVYGEETLEENLNFIAEALGNKGKTSREVIRNYFLNDFYKDHLKIYQKRPIYWLFDSGKQNGFKALVYMHRWNADTIGNVRVEYLHKTQKIYMNELDRMQDTIDNSNDAREVSAAKKAKEKLTKQLKETKDYDASMAHLANMRIDIDLDDGVKVNYEKVQTDSEGKNLGILAKI